MHDASMMPSIPTIGWSPLSSSAAGMKRLRVQARLEEDLAALRAERPGEITEADEEAILGLGEDLHTVWNHATSSPELKKRIIRTLIAEIVVRLDGHRVMMILHWQGGDHTELSFLKNRTGQHRWRTDPEVEALVRELARVMSDAAIASLLNRFGPSAPRRDTPGPRTGCACLA
jgi:hypothetical protein